MVPLQTVQSDRGILVQNQLAQYQVSVELEQMSTVQFLCLVGRKEPGTEAPYHLQGWNFDERDWRPTNSISACFYVPNGF